MESTISHYCSRPDLSPDDISGKIILDLGSGYGAFGRACAHARLATVYSVDADLIFLKSLAGPRRVRGHPMNTIAGRAEALPFRAGSFDLVLAHYSVPMLLPAKEAVRAMCEELCRVLKGGGEARLVPARAEFGRWFKKEIAARQEGAAYEVATKRLSLPETAFGRRRIIHPLLIIRKRKRA